MPAGIPSGNGNARNEGGGQEVVAYDHREGIQCGRAKEERRAGCVKRERMRAGK